jgi:hypothetical protein
VWHEDLWPTSASFSTGMSLVRLQEGHSRRCLYEQITMHI